MNEVEKKEDENSEDNDLTKSKNQDSQNSGQQSDNSQTLSISSYNTNSHQIENKKYQDPYIVREPLESHYFDPWVGGWTRLNNRFVVNPQLYGYWIKVVEIHEKLHNIYKTGNEAFVEKMTWYNFRNGYFNLSGSYS
jgi:hypothetical protein